MRTAFYIARRYFFSRKSQNVINIISGISVFGIAISTAALVVVLSAFNGIEGLVLSLFSEFDADIEVSIEQGKTFDQRRLDSKHIQTVEGVNTVAPVIEEIVILKNDEKWVNARIMGVKPSFLERVNMKEHLRTGNPVLEDENGPLMLCGAGVLQKLSANTIYLGGTSNSITVYGPKRDVVYRPTATTQPFNKKSIRLIGSFTYNKEVDMNYCIVPIDKARSMLGYGQDITRYEVDVAPNVSLSKIKKKLERHLPAGFVVKTRKEKNDLIYQTSQTEKWITVFILGFIFLLASFNMIASLTMLMLEKRKDIYVLMALGAMKKQIRNIFFLEGVLINCIGAGLGLILGYAICWAQLTWGFITMQGGIVEVYPVAFKWSDFYLILGLIAIVGTLSSFLPVRFLRIKPVRL